MQEQRIVFRVKQIELSKGIRKSCEACPAALAIKEIWNKPHDKILVGSKWMFINTLNGEWFGYLDKDLQDFIWEFDNDCIVCRPLHFGVNLVYFPYGRFERATI